MRSLPPHQHVSPDTRHIQILLELGDDRSVAGQRQFCVVGPKINRDGDILERLVV